MLKVSFVASSAFCIVLLSTGTVRAQRTMQNGRVFAAPEVTQAIAKGGPTVNRGPSQGTQDLAFSFMNAGLREIDTRQPDYEKAEKSFLRALELNPTLATARLGLGFVYAAEGRYAEAETIYKGMLRSLPESAEIHFNLGIVYLRQGRTAEARLELPAITRSNAKLANRLRTEIEKINPQQ